MHSPVSPTLTISDLLLLAHVVWDLTDTLSLPTAPTTSIGESAQAEILDLLDRLRNIHLSIQYLIKQSRQTNTSEKAFSAIQDPLREFYEPCWKTLGKIQKLVGTTVEQVLVEGLDCDMYEQRIRRANAFEEAHDTVWIMDGGNLVDYVKASRSNLIVFEDQLNWIVETVRTMTLPWAVETHTTNVGKSSHQQEHKNKYENAALEVPMTRERSGTGASTRSIASTISQMNDVHPGSNPSKGGSLEDEIRGTWSMGGHDTIEAREWSTNTEPSINGLLQSPLPVPPPHSRTIHSSTSTRQLSSNDDMIVLDSMRSKSPDSTESFKDKIKQEDGFHQTFEARYGDRVAHSDNSDEQTGLRKYGTSPPPQSVRRNPIKRPSKQAYVKDESSEDEAIVLTAPGTPLEAPKPPKHTSQDTSDGRNRHEDSATSKSTSAKPSRLEPKLDVTFEIETWMGGFYSFTDCRHAIINPEFLKDGRNRIPLFKCLCAKYTSSGGYTNTFKPVSAFSKNNHDEKIGQYFGTTNTLIVNNIGQSPTHLLAVNLIEKILFEGPVTERNIVNELHLSFTDEASAKTFQDGIGHILRVKAVRALHEDRLERSSWVDFQDMTSNKKDVLLVAYSCKIWRESAIGDNTSCEWMDKSKNVSWQKLPGHSGLRELSVVHYMKIEADNGPEMFQDDNHWSLEFTKSTQAALSIVGPEAKSRLYSRFSHTLHHSLDKGCLTLRPSNTVIHETDMYGVELSTRRQIGNVEIQLKRVKNTDIRQVLDQAIKNLQMIGTSTHIGDENLVKGNNPSKEAVLPEPRCVYFRDNALENVYSMGRPFGKSAFRDGKLEILYDHIKQSMKVVASDSSTGRTELTQQVTPGTSDSAIDYASDHFTLNYTTIMREGGHLHEKDNKEVIISKDGELKLRYQFKRMQDLKDFKTAYDDTYKLCAVPSPHAQFRHVPARQRQR